MRVQDVMTKSPACCTKAATLVDVARIMRDWDCGAVPVVDADGSHELVGIITDRDIVVRSLAEAADPLYLSAEDCMSRVVATVRPETSIEDCAQLMEEHQVRRVPVVGATGECCGIVAQADLARDLPGEKTARIVRQVSQPLEAAIAGG